ncbi:hypothetical protein [Desulfovibrio ferrophilus]|uniref:DNA polymerase n=1 Tax=Desulfovibrio ferrophilus TaxID=241368 RepID=A0A2Z6B154_9BACT|nr:hypothetical protein [Desulfovibrio ferrophilus]BBD09183.1 DNA polymerase [Desulfovibrio ferrophilus]
MDSFPITGKPETTGLPTFREGAAENNGFVPKSQIFSKIFDLKIIYKKSKLAAAKAISHVEAASPRSRLIKSEFC